MPVKVEYLPGLFTNDGFGISKIDFIKDQSIRVYLSESEKETSNPPLHTDDIQGHLTEAVGKVEDMGDIEITVIYGNQEIGTAELDITEIEIFQGTFTLKLYSLNNLTKSKARQEKQKKEEIPQKGKRFFFTAIRNFLFPQPLVLKWNMAKL
ncbi:hypothetical protein GCM10011339_16750 [Echinicola rosea]|uniref:Uncharacterized protein n=2 Tax=Echinicola rosea TaxID=1807691 RepID=A0ABQ1UZK3_9BACT|nr:hypothetical protein GCM10011339_16750 [Echinicola rosea]